MIKRILVPLDSSPFSDAAVDFACRLAKDHGAEVAGLVVLDVPGIEKSVGPIPMGGLYYAEREIAEKEKRAEARIKTLLQKFKERCASEGVAHVESERQGSPPKNILQESFYYDCLVMGLRTYFHFETDAGADHQYGTSDDHSGRSLEKLMTHSAVPIVAVPMDWTCPTRKLRALIAIDGKMPSIRALHSFIHVFLPASTDVTLLTSCDEMAEGEFLLNQAETYLRLHGYSDVRKEWTSVPIRQALDGSEFSAADLIALGAHSELGVVDFMIGSVCKDLIDRASKPLLIAR